jgi:hypothetical protein
MPFTGARPAIVVSCLALLAGLSGCFPSEPVEPADLVLRGGVVVTVDDALPEAEAIAVDGYEISISRAAWPSPASSRVTAIT